MARTTITSLLIVAVSVVLLAGCGEQLPPHMRPIPPETKALLREKGMSEDAPIFVRIFKKESELEIWKVKDDGRYHHFKTYPICNWSGGLGPKIKQGDKQAPEGFYRVSAKQMNPNSDYYLAFNLGYPNAYDKANGRTGNFLMVHGDCRSAGCYAMTDALIEEIYALAREAFEGGQEAFWVHAYPFRMTPENMRQHADDKFYDFWRDLQKGYDHFEYTRKPPKVAVCEKKYLVNVAFVGGNRKVDPAAECPVYEQLPVEKAPEPPRVQEVKQERPAGRDTARRDLPPAMAFAPIEEDRELQAPADDQTPAAFSTPADTAGAGSSGTWRTFTSTPASPSRSGYIFRNNATLGR